MTIDQDMAKRFLDKGIPLVKGTREALIAIKNLLAGNIKISNEKFDELINDKNTPRDIIIRAAKFLDTIK